MKITNKILLLLLLIILGLVIYWFLPFSPFKNDFNKSIKAKVERINRDVQNR